MKVAITDFDGTLKPFDNKIPRGTIDAIHRWRAAGNKFGIATGRELTMLEHDLRHYDITTDFLICVNGAVIFDAKRDILQSIRMERRLKERFLRLPLIANFSGAMICFCERHCYSIRPYPEMTLEVAPEIELEEILERDDVVQIGLRFNSEAEAAAARELIEGEISELRGNQNRNYLDVNVRPVDKRFGVECLISLMGWNGAELYVIGDDRNDLPMIVGFNGYTVTRAPEFMHSVAHRAYDTVGDLLIDNL